MDSGTNIGFSETGSNIDFGISGLELIAQQGNWILTAHFRKPVYYSR